MFLVALAAGIMFFAGVFTSLIWTEIMYRKYMKSFYDLYVVARKVAKENGKADYRWNGITVTIYDET